MVAKGSSQPHWTTAPTPRLIVSIHSFDFLRSIGISSIVNDGWRAPVAHFAGCAGGTGRQHALLSNRGPVPHPPWKGRGPDSRGPAAAPLHGAPAGPALPLSPVAPAGWRRLFARRFADRIQLRPCAPVWRDRRSGRASYRGIADWCSARPLES